jgi:hypothetical protein
MRLMLLCVVVAMMFVGADAAYGLGGGGHSGDGRQDFSQQDAHNYAIDRGGPATTPLIIPEPIAVLLLGLGIIGLAGLTRKFRGYR